MLPEIAHLFLILSICAGLGLALLACLSPAPHRGLCRSFAIAQWLSGALAYGLLTLAFIQNDFSVAYVANHSHRGLELIYRICAVWGAHEGSLLLWLFILQSWTMAFALSGRSLSTHVHTRALAVLGALGAAMGLFLVATSNPFVRLLPHIPLEGGDLNPLLQDIGFILHPPCLYLGYVGFAIPFALSIAALLEDTVTPLTIFQSMRSWALVAFACLTLGIGLGSWWAYYELGWGGWWFWDPVENAALMPWILGAALVHALYVAQSRQVFYRWVLLLAMLCCGMSLLGTFLVRSGILSSVHTFAADPHKGRLLLLGFGGFMGGGLLLFALRHPRWAQTQSSFAFGSKESLLLMNNVILCAVAAMILVGTLYPLILELYFHQQAIVGAPYFNRFFVPMMAILCLLMGVAPASNWQHNPKGYVRTFAPPLILTFLGILLLGRGEGIRSVGLGVSLWIVSSTLYLLLIRPRAWSLKRIGMVIAHVGIAVTIVGMTISSLDSIEKDVHLQEGESIAVGAYQFHLVATHPTQDLHTQGIRAQIEVFVGDKHVAQLWPEKRYFHAREIATSETALDPGFFRDLYVAMGDAPQSGGWNFRIYVKPFVRWIWLGALMVAAGALLSLQPFARLRHALRRH